MTVGVLSAIPTALSGAADWADTSEEPRRIGLIHALLNSTGLVLMSVRCSRDAAIDARTGHRPVDARPEPDRRLGLAGRRAGLSPGHQRQPHRLRAARRRVSGRRPAERARRRQAGRAHADVDGPRVPIALLKTGQPGDGHQQHVPALGRPAGRGQAARRRHGRRVPVARLAVQPGRWQRAARAPPRRPSMSTKRAFATGNVEVRSRAS